MKVFSYEDVPEPKLVGEGIYRITIPQPFYSANHVYLILSKEPALIDAGFVLNLGLLQRSLQKINFSFRQIKHIFFTHNHIDHISSAISLPFYTRAKLYGMEGMANNVGDYIEHLNHFNRAEIRLFYKGIHNRAERNRQIHRLKKNWNDFLSEYETGRKSRPIIKMDVELVEGDVIDIGGREIGFLHTPGHNIWHLTPYILEEGIYFTGDVILNNISSIYAEVDGDLSKYHNTLQRLLKLPIQRILPAHGEEPKDPQRAIKLLSKTLNLLERGVIRRLKEGDSYDLSELACAAMGSKVKTSQYYVVSLAIMHSIILKLIASGQVVILEVDPPYERYCWYSG